MSLICGKDAVKKQMSFQGSTDECRVDTAVTVDGTLFHALAAATRNACVAQ